MSDTEVAVTTPKVFVSYAWTSEAHKTTVRIWAERLLASGIDVVLDAFDLKEGQDLHKFMERTVRDPSVTHVLVVSDRNYATKADGRVGGAGTEAQLISKEVYEKTDQTKYIPIACEFENGKPCLPAYMSSRVWIDFSTEEKVNGNWEQLVRLLHGKPRFVKPLLGKPPTYLADDAAAPNSPARAKFEDLRLSIAQGRPTIRSHRREFLDACLSYADELRVRKRPDETDPGKRVLEDCRKLVVVRDHIVDWVLLESEASPSEEFVQALIDTLERLKEVKSRPKEVTTWNETWFEAQKIFVYETFLYIVAALIQTRAFHALHEVVTSHYLVPESERSDTNQFENFEHFYAWSDTLQKTLAPEGYTLRSPAGELIKLQAQRSDITFDALIEADYVLFFVALAQSSSHWYPQLMHYVDRWHQFPLFVRAAQHKHFKALATITGIVDAEALRQRVKENFAKAETNKWSNFWGTDLSRGMNLDKLDTLK
jgi:hypothetical protein